MGALSKLEAVNRILRSAGEFPVNSLLSVSNDTLMAETVLDEQVLYHNMEGTLQNTFYTTLKPDSNGKILLGDNVLHIEPVGSKSPALVTTRGSNPTYLFDIGDNTDVFTESVEVQQVLRLDFEDLPTPDQFSVVDTSARLYQMQTVGDVNQDSLLAQQQMMSIARARQADTRQRKANFLFGANENPYRARWTLSRSDNPRLG